MSDSKRSDTKGPDDAELFEFVDEFLDDRERGNKHPLDYYTARYPKLADAVRAEYASLTSSDASNGATDSAAQSSSKAIGPYKLIRELGRGGQGAVWAADDPRLGRKVALKILPPSFAVLSSERRLRFQREAEILARLDHPGICTVYEAEVKSDMPYIAMQLVEGSALSSLISAEQERRAGGGSVAASSPKSKNKSAGKGKRKQSAQAKREGRSTARLPVGPRDATELREVLLFFERMARALHAAHEAGVMHRDMKPANVMVTPDGEPVILDFGQAKEEGAATELTASGEIFGTPGYMAPEQLELQPDDLDRRVDVWALGVSLHEALTLERPFDAPTTPALLVKIATAEPADARALCPLVDEDLRVVLATAMERSLDRRYPTALALADDLRRIRLFEPIRARSAGPLLRFKRMVRRHPALTASTVGTILALALGLAASMVLLGKERSALEVALARHLASRAEELVHEDPSAALAIATEAVLRAPVGQTRSSLYKAIDACTLRALFDGDPARIFRDLVPSPDAKHVAAALSDGSLRLYELQGGAEVVRYGDDSQGAQLVRFLPDGDELFSVGDDQRLRRYNALTGELLGEWELGGKPLDLLLETGSSHAWVLEPGYCTVLAWDIDELRRWPTGLPAARRIHSLASREQVALSSAGLSAPDNPEDGYWVASYTPIGKMVSQTGMPDWVRAVATDSEQHFLYIAAGNRLHRVRAGDFGQPTPAREFTQPVGAVACGPNGTLAVAEVADADSSAWFLDGFEGPAVQLVGHEGKPIIDIEFSPTGDRIATAAFDRSVRTYDASTGAPLRVHRWPFTPARVSWTPDGTGLLTRSIGPTAHLWAAEENPWLYRMGDGDAPLTHAAFAPDGSRALTSDENGVLRLWDTTPVDAAASGSPGALVWQQTTHAGAVNIVRAAPSGGRWLSAGSDGRLCVWNARGSTPQVLLLDSADDRAALIDAGWSANGQWIFGLSADGRLLAHEVATGVQHSWTAVTCARFSPSGAQLAIGLRGEAGTGVDHLRMFDLAQNKSSLFDISLKSKKPRREADSSEPKLLAIAFRPDGDELALIHAESGVHLFDALGNASTRSLIVRSRPSQVIYSPDGQLFLQRGDSGPRAILFQDLSSSAELRHDNWHTKDLTAADISQDGRLWLTASKDGVVIVSRVGDPIPIARLAMHEGPVRFACFAPGAGPARVLTIGEDGYARIWPVDPLPAARALRPRDLRPWEVAREQRLAAPLKYEPRSN